MIRLRAAHRVVLAAIAAGCSGTPTVVDLPTGGIYRDNELAGGDLPVVVLGAPFPGMPHEALATLVVTSMPQPWGQGTRYVAMPPGVVPERRVVWAFGGGIAGGDGSAVCQSATGGGPAGGNIRLYGAVCRGPSALSAVQAAVDGVRGPDDPAFRGLIEAATNELFSPQPGQQQDRFLRPFGGFRR
jgi:hypothetical protein